MGYGLINLENETWDWLRRLAALEGKWVDEWIAQLLEQRVAEAKLKYPDGLESINVDMSLFKFDLQTLEDLAKDRKSPSEEHNINNELLGICRSSLITPRFRVVT